MKWNKKSWQRVMYMAWPLIVSNSFWNIQITVDRIFLGQFSTEALGAATTVMSVYWVPMALLHQTAGYVATFVAQYYGAKEYKKIGSVVWQALHLSLFGGIAFLSLIWFSPFIFKLIGHSAKVQSLETLYFSSVCFAALPTAVVSALSGFLTGLGKTRTVLWLNGVGVALNVLFDYMFIFGHYGSPQLGVAGAGYATALSAVGSVLVGIFLVFTQKYESSYKIRSSWRFHFSTMKRFLKFGLPSGLQWALEGLAFTVFLIFVGRYNTGDIDLASSSIVITVMMLSALPVMGVSQAVQIIVGQDLGEKKPEKAVEATWAGTQISILYVLFMASTFILFPGFYLNWFENTESGIWTEVLETSSYLLFFVAAFVAFDSLNLNFSFALKGAGDTRFVSLVALILPWPFMVAPAYLFSDFNGAVYYAWAGASLFVAIQASVFLWRFLDGKWKNMSVI